MSPVSPQGPFALSDEAIERALLEPAEAGLLDDHFGETQHAALRRLAQDAAGRSVRGRPRVLVLPGIMGSRLGRERPGLPTDIVWLDPLDVALGGLGDLSLDGGDPGIGPVGVFLFTYLSLKLRLRLQGFDAEFHPFDWRRSLADLGQDLARRIDETDGPVTHLVAHSMGGLVARAALAHGPRRLGRVVMLGTPNHGSFAPVQAFRGTLATVRKVDFIDPFHSAEELARDVFGTFPGLLEMIPSPARFGIDLFEPSSWPTGGVRPDPDRLAAARTVRDALPADHDDTYLVVGVDRDTVVGARVEDGEFVYEVTRDGDGTVPRVAALLDDARRTYHVAEEHGNLPNDRDVAEAVGSILSTGATARLAETYDPPRAGSRLVSERSLAVPPYGGSPGQAVSLREQRDLLEELAAPDRSPEPVLGIEKAGQAAGQTAAGRDATAFSDRVTVGRARQHRIEFAMAFGSIAQVDAQAYVLGLFRHVAPGGAARELDALMDGAIGQMVERRMFNANVGEISIVPTGRHPLRAEVVAFAGLGPYDGFEERTLEIVGENLVRTFAATRVDEFALVPLGGGTGRFTTAALSHLLTGFLRGLREADRAQRFRGITICETNRDRFLAIRNEVYRLSATALFDGVEVVLREIDLPPAPATRDASDLPTPQSVYLTMRQESDERDDPVTFSASVLTSGAKAAISRNLAEFPAKALDDLLAKLPRLTQGSLDQFGADLAGLVLPEGTRAILAEFANHPLVVVHDPGTARVPWEAIRIGDAFPSTRGGMTHRYVAQDLSIAKWLDGRRIGPTLDVLLVVDPTGNLPGAREEGDRVRHILEGMRAAVTIRELRGPAARKQELISCLSSGRFDVVHYAGHAFFDPTDRARSGLICADEEVLSGRDVAGLGNLPGLVFFNACEAARVRRNAPSSSRAGRRPAKAREEAQRNVGFAEAFLRGGVANFLGTYWPVGDASAAAFSAAFYEDLTAGRTLHEALLSGRGAAHATGSIDWADYVLYGDPDFVLKTDPGGEPDADPAGPDPRGPLPKRDAGPGTWVTCRGPAGTGAGTPVLLDMGPRRLATDVPARVSQARHRFEITAGGKRFRTEVVCRPADIGDPQVVVIREAVA